MDVTKYIYSDLIYSLQRVFHNICTADKRNSETLILNKKIIKAKCSTFKLNIYT